MFAMWRIEVAVVFPTLCWAAAAAPVWGQVEATESAKLRASDGAEEDHFGDSTDISGDAVIIGAPNNDNGNGVDAGAAYVYRYYPGPPASWVEGLDMWTIHCTNGW